MYWSRENPAADVVSVARAVSRSVTRFGVSMLYRIGLFFFLIFLFCSFASAQQSSTEFQSLRRQALDRINADRSAQKLPPVKLDELASNVGDAHCKEIVERGVISHWSLDGRKPYMRYSWAGGRDAVAENLSYTQGGIKIDPIALSQHLTFMEDGFLSEQPPNDGHRRNILDPIIPT